MDFGNNKNTVVTVGQQLKNSQGSVGVVEKIVQEFIFVRFPEGIRRMRRSSVGKELFVIQQFTPTKPVQDNRMPPRHDVISERKRITDRRLIAEQPATETKFTELKRDTEKQRLEPEIIEKKKTIEKRVENKENFIAGSTPLFVRKGTNWIPAVFLRFEMKAGKKVIYVNCDGKISFYAYPSRFVRKAEAGDTLPKEVFVYSDLSDISTVDIDIRRIINAYKQYPISQAATTDKQTELSLERRYHGRVSSALDEMYLRETKRIGESMDMERQAYVELRETFKEEQESGYDPMSRDGIILGPTDYISVKLKRENAEKMSQTAHRKMKEIDETREKPYFARIDCGASADDIHTVYIGDTAIQNLVTDWRDKYIGNVFYYSGILKDAEGIFIALKRHITFDNQILTQYVDEINSYRGMTLIPQTAEDKKYISDELLMQLLEESRSQQSVHDIIRSIQQNQYKMITSDIDKNVLINGCAGSGKTMILYHRLSYIAYNEHEKFVPERVFAITPTELFGSVTDDLISKLQINNISNAPYLQTVHNFIGVYKAKRQLIDGEISNALSATGMWESAYSQTMYNEYQEILDNSLKDRENFVNWAFQLLSSVLGKYGFPPVSPDDYERNIVLWLSNSDFEYRDKKGKKRRYGPEIFTDNAWENFEESITAKKNREKRKKTLSENMSMLRTVLRQTPIKTAEGKIREAQHGGASLLDEPTVFGKLLCLTYVRKHAVELEHFLKGGKEGTVYFFLCQYAMSIFKDRYGLGSERFSFEEIYYIRALAKHFGPLSYEPTWIFIDEFQNYSLFELETLRAVYPKAVFNFYGDFSQCIEEKGVKEADVVSSFGVNCYTINENYRNALEITQYINEKLGKDMYPIGIHGGVEEVQFDDCSFELNGRTAIIVKKIDSSVLNRLAGVLSCINLVNTSNMNLDYGKLNLVEIQNVKGLEFETAYVVEADMSANERYVAYTRALNRLIVVREQR